MRALIPQAGTVPFRGAPGGPEILLISTVRGKWGIPKGIIDPGELGPDTAVRETREEAGVEGDLIADPVGQYDVDKWGGTCRVTVYLLRVTRILDRWAEVERERLWLPASSAPARVEKRALRDVLTLAAERIERLRL